MLPRYHFHNLELHHVLTIFAFFYSTENSQREAAEEAETSLWDSMVAAPTETLEMIMDPNKKEREEEESLKKEVRASKKQWRKIRQERFQFLDSNMEATSDEKKDGR